MFLRKLTIGGAAFNGTVEIAAKWMDPTDLSTMDQMPGNLQGVNRESQEVALASYGMIAVELQDETGAYLPPIGIGFLHSTLFHSKF